MKYSKMSLEESKRLLSTQVAFTNTTFGKLPLDKNDPDFWVKLNNQALLIKEELNELFTAIEKKDMTQVRDAVSDVNVTNLGVPFLAGFNVEKDMLEVFASNLSKVSKTIEDALKTQEKYLKLGVPTYIQDCLTIPGFVVKVTETVVGNDGKEYPKDKFLKCVVGFKEPIFED